MANNYVKMLMSARELFLERDQQAMIDLWSLEHDDGYLYMEYFGQRLKLDRRTAEVSYAQAPAAGEFRSAGFTNSSMALFDLLTYAPTRPHANGSWSSISTLGGIIGAGHDRTLSHESTAAKFAGKMEALARACERLGGVPAGKGDVSYAVPVFRDFGILFQFWDGDDEFPANIKFLFDANARRFMHYETLWYVMGDLGDRLDFYVNGVVPGR
ncbi:MAG: DUF3786 domain-containing protein [Clostridia bacterium]|nr:DUF3786 domain-containing protein [Clostridia bacterium]